MLPLFYAGEEEVKTATDLFHEYYAKPPIERVNTTLQDYVHNYHKQKADELLAYLETTYLGDDVDIEKIKEIIG